MANLTSVSGVRIWLSGSIPDGLSADEKTRILTFTKALAKAAFREGAQLLHGFHPSLTPTLLEAAREYRAVGSKKAPLTLFVSTFYREPSTLGYGENTVSELEGACVLRQIPSAPGRERSLKELRVALAAEADVLIAVGGKWWEQDRAQAGVPAEFLLALDRGIPSFLLGGLGGATAGYLRQHPEVLRNLHNGLDPKANEELALESNVNILTEHVLDQIARLPLGRRETDFGQRFRILCLDGGGIRGAFTAAVLAHWEEVSKLRVADHFDLIAGTSTGGILAIGLGLGLSAQTMLKFYKKDGPDIFPVDGLFDQFRRKLANFIASKFDASVLQHKLEKAYDKQGKKATLADSPHRLLITSYDLMSGTPRLYRTSHSPIAKGHDDMLAVTVARATSAAPTYFDPEEVIDPIANQTGVDGGVWANCPALAALGEAVHALNVPMSRIDMLSVGTAGLPTFVEKPKKGGKLVWAAKAPDLFMNSQMSATLSHIQQLLGDQHFLRVDDPEPRVETMDQAEDIEFLASRGAVVAERDAAKVMARFLNGVSVSPWRKL